jgi:small nuclear ribonucleoprotein E
VSLLLFYFVLQKKTRVRIWLYEDAKTQIEGQIIGFDEYMNMVLDDAVEIGKKRVEIGRILLKGDSITLLQEAQPQQKKEPVGQQ